ncbi:hypothetical protein Tco_0505608 [Tanacetum coccineum]
MWCQRMPQQMWCRSDSGVVLHFADMAALFETARAERLHQALVSSEVPEINLKIITYLTGVTQRKEELKIKNLLQVATSKDLAVTQLSGQRVMIR